MDSRTVVRFRGLIRLISLNLKHYRWALFGIGLELDPDYPIVWDALPNLLSDSVLEYRLYGLFAPWCAFLALILPNPPVLFLAVFWAFLAWQRSGYYRSALAFWRQAYAECPDKFRVMVRLAEELSRELERLDKAGEPWGGEKIQGLLDEAIVLQELIVKKRKNV